MFNTNVKIDGALYGFCWIPSFLLILPHRVRYHEVCKYIPPECQNMLPECQKYTVRNAKIYRPNSNTYSYCRYCINNIGDNT